MIQHKLIRVISTLSATEIKAFQQFIESDFFNPNLNTRDLLAFLIPFHPEYQAEKLDELYIFGKLFPGEKYRAQRLREEFSRLFALLKKFLAYQEFQLHPEQEAIWTLAQFRKRKLPKAFQTQWKAIQKSLDQETMKDAEYYRLQSELAQEANGLFGSKEIRIADDSLQTWVDNLDIFYLTHKLRESCEMLNRQHILNADYELRMMGQVAEYLNHEGKSLLDIPAIRIYYQIFLMFTQPEEESHYAILVNLLNENHPSFSPEEGRGMYKYVQNYCIRKINQGNSEYLTKLFRLYQSELENGIIFSNGWLAHTDYKNIVTVGLRVGEFTWVHDFLYEYQEKVAEPFRMNVFNYCLASWYQEKGQHDQAIRLLQKVEFTDLQYQISARYLLFKAYYETEEWESLIYLIKAFQNFIRRNKGISTDNRVNHRNFLKILQLLVRLRMRQDFLETEEFERRYGKIEDQLMENQSVPHLGWLRERLRDL
ncbi:MAG: hypothetical protein KDE26_20380 [Bacteroidetes bacterium]|nr:hypothetical protein [Bacteroidota bacterium]